MALKPCRECGEKVSSFAMTCPKCGKNYPTTTVSAGTVLGGICAAAMIGIAFGYFSDHHDHTPAQAIVAPVASNIQMPADEVALLAAVAVARQQYDAGANDMAKGAARPARAQALCAVIGNRTAHDWVGKVVTLNTNGDGKGVFGVEIADDTTLATWNNDFSDVGYHTLIEPSSPLFGETIALHTNQVVRFSGTFSPSETDCIQEQSVTLYGSLSSPKFVFRLSSVMPAD
jgi:RNA polymerase subunit RPABC4/transcription elongation factor Spt4